MGGLFNLKTGFLPAIKKGLEHMFKGFSGEDPSLEKFSQMTGTQKKKLKKGLKAIDFNAFDLSKNPTFMAGNKFIQDMLNPSSEAYKNFEAPYLRQFREEIVPQVAERFSQYDAQNSSAFTQAMGQQSAGLSERLASMRTNAMAGMIPQAGQYGTAQAGIYGGLFGQTMGSQPFGYTMNPGTQGWGGSAMQALGAAAPAAIAAMSSESVKENIRPYDKGLEVIKDLEVKIYNYIEAVGGSTDRVGVIAETVPEEISGEIEGIKAVDLYGLIGLLINSVKELNKRIETIEQRSI